MKKGSGALTFLLAVILAVTSLTSCHRSEVIPRKDMARIYADMFLLDATIEKQRFELRHPADTSRVYAAVLEKYGYTEDDFLRSQEKYILDANRYARILKKSQAMLEVELKDLKKERERLNMMRQIATDKKAFIAKYLPDTLMLYDTSSRAFCLSLDSLLAFDFTPHADTLFAGPEIIVRDWELLDSLAKVRADSVNVAAMADSLTVADDLQALPHKKKPLATKKQIKDVEL